MDRIKLYVDGDQWCALYGDNIQEGKCAFSPVLRDLTWKDSGRWNALDKLTTEYPELKNVPYVNLEE